MSKKIYFCNVSNSAVGIEVEFNVNQKVRQIKRYLSERLRANLEDYTLTAVVGDNSYLLFEDESIASILARPKE